VGVSVVNALSQVLEVTIKRDGQVHRISFENGEKSIDLHVIDSCGKRNTGTSARFLPNPKYFDSAKFSVSRLRHVLRAKAVLCPGLKVIFKDEHSGEQDEWFYEDGLKDYLSSSTNGWERTPEAPFVGNFSAEREAVDWAWFTYRVIRCHARILRNAQFITSWCKTCARRYLGQLRVCFIV